MSCQKQLPASSQMTPRAGFPGSKEAPLPGRRARCQAKEAPARPCAAKGSCNVNSKQKGERARERERDNKKKRARITRYSEFTRLFEAENLGLSDFSSFRRLRAAYEAARLAAVALSAIHLCLGSHEEGEGENFRLPDFPSPHKRLNCQNSFRNFPPLRTPLRSSNSRTPASWPHGFFPSFLSCVHLEARPGPLITAQALDPLVHAPTPVLTRDTGVCKS